MARRQRLVGAVRTQMLEGVEGCVRQREAEGVRPLTLVAVVVVEVVGRRISLHRRRLFFLLEEG